jgi:hypothetical protein
MTEVRIGHTATLLPSGKVLVAGGVDTVGFLLTAEVYDPATDTWLPNCVLVTCQARASARAGQPAELCARASKSPR